LYELYALSSNFALTIKGQSRRNLIVFRVHNSKHP